MRANTKPELMGQSVYKLWRPLCDFFGAFQLWELGRIEKLEVFAMIPQSLKKTQTNSSMKSRGKSLWRVYA